VVVVVVVEAGADVMVASIELRGGERRFAVWLGVAYLSQ